MQISEYENLLPEADQHERDANALLAKGISPTDWRVLWNQRMAREKRILQRVARPFHERGR